MPFLGKKSERSNVSEEASKLERFKREADTLYSVYLIENAYNVLRRFCCWKYGFRHFLSK